MNPQSFMPENEAGILKHNIPGNLPHGAMRTFYTSKKPLSVLHHIKMKAAYFAVN